MPDAAPSSSPKAVFLSYTSDDMAVALAVCEALREAGIEVWMDRSELQGGDAWDANIQRQIRECALIIPIISERTQARREGYFRLEWRLADERMRLVADGTPLILPVAADETREQDALVPKSFLTVQWSRLPLSPYAITPDGRSLLFSSDVGASDPDIGMAPLDGKGEIKWLINAKGFSEVGPTLSPDGKWMAYSSNESGLSEVYVSPFPKVDEDRVLISNAGGDRPLWSHDGKELFYVGGITPATRRFMTAAVSAEGGKFRVMSRSPLWGGTNESLHFITNNGFVIARPIGPSHDGQRFLVLKEFNATGDRPQERIHVVQNWTEELKRRVPVPPK